MCSFALTTCACTVVHSSALNYLLYAEGASWSPSLVCLPGTRVDLLEDIWNWIQAADHTKSAEVFLLSDVAGTGKSTIAHTIGQRCQDAGLLGSSFFFDRDIPDRSKPRKLFSSIAHDICRLSKNLAEHITTAIEGDRSIVSASISRQFDELILGPSHLHRFDKPVVIVIDALDEGYDLELLKIIRDKVPMLPGSFRIFITSRPEDEIITDLLDAAHIHWRSIDIHGSTNQADIAVYAEDRLRYVASRKRLGPDWPGPELANEFRAKAEGLFIWVYVVSEYLSSRKTYDPTSKLLSFLHNRSLLGHPAEVKMDELYAEILSNCDWSDQEFVEMYNVAVGSIMVLRTPITASALQSLHRANPSLQICEVLRPLNSLFTGLMGGNQLIRVLHMSLRDFLTCRAQTTPSFTRFYVDEKDHSQRMALLCLRVLNDDLDADIPGTGYLTRPRRDHEGLPHILESDVSGALWYSCRFWPEHVVEVESPVSDMFLDALRKFLSTRLIRSVEVLSSRGQFQGLGKVRNWLEVSVMIWKRSP